MSATYVLMGFRCCKYKVDRGKDVWIPTNVYCGHEAPFRYNSLLRVKKGYLSHAKLLDHSAEQLEGRPKKLSSWLSSHKIKFKWEKGHYLSSDFWVCRVHLVHIFCTPVTKKIQFFKLKESWESLFNYIILQARYGTHNLSLFLSIFISFYMTVLILSAISCRFAVVLTVIELDNLISDPRSHLQSKLFCSILPHWFSDRPFLFWCHVL